MNTYSIKEMELISGIKAHTIRMWENRYGIISPIRTSTNIRKYNDLELRKLLNIAFLTRKGNRISQVAQLSDTDLNQKVQQLEEQSLPTNEILELLIRSMLKIEEKSFSRILNQTITEKGIENTIIKIMFPFFERVGILWQTGVITPAYEHYVSHLFRQKLISQIDQLSSPVRGTVPEILFFLPENEYHEFGLLFYCYLLKKMGYHNIYLGQSVPLEAVADLGQNLNPYAILTAFVGPSSKKEIERYLQILSHTLPSKKIFIHGYQIKTLKPALPRNIKIIRSPSDCRRFFKHY